MKTPILLATTNSGKIAELQVLLQAQEFGSNIEVLSLKDFPDCPPVEETGKTFAENSLIKAKAYFEHTKIPVLSDDSGLVVPSLGGDPGVYSARYAGEYATAEDNIEKLLSKMEEISERDAFFVSNLVFLKSPYLYLVSEGYCYGEISQTPKGESGFGYDPIFFLPEYEKTMAELSFSQKQEISHRGKAIRNLATILRCFLYENL